jgi:transcriptional regulator with AAA-type ATPase domain
MFDNDEPLYLDKQMMKIAKKYQSDAQTIDPMKDAIQDFLEIRVPANWQELSNSIKQTYAQGVLENLEQSKWLAPQLKEPFTKIDRTTTREILNVVFGKSVDKYLTGAVNNDAKKVKLIMDNMDGWESKANVVVGGRRSRGYVRN